MVYLFTVKGSENAETFDAPISYFTNPSFPDTDWMPSYSSFTIKVSDPDVCQLRLDFVEFLLSGPSLITSPFGHCLHDRMAVFASQTQNLGLSAGNLLCGDMKGQHSKHCIYYLEIQYFCFGMSAGHVHSVQLCLSRFYF